MVRRLSAGGRWIRNFGSWSRDRQTVMGGGLLSKRERICRGTEGSNPVSSSGESQQRTVRVPGSELLAAAPSCLGIALRAEGGSVAARCRVGGVQNACGAPRKAKPRLLWAPWQLEGEALVEAKHDATLLALKDHSRPRPGAPERGGLT
jgi:hypothetical protein